MVGTTCQIAWAVTYAAVIERFRSATSREGAQLRLLVLANLVAAPTEPGVEVRARGTRGSENLGVSFPVDMTQFVESKKKAQSQKATGLNPLGCDASSRENPTLHAAESFSGPCSLCNPLLLSL